MSNVGDVTVLEEKAAAPKATLSDVVNDKCVIFMEVEGLDLTQELTKLKKKVDSAHKMVKSYETKMAAPSYEEKVPADVREQNSKNLSASRIELEELNRAVVS